MTNPFPFKTLATAIAFSPFLEANLHESTRIASMLGAKIVLIHVGDRSANQEQELQRMLDGTNFDQSKVEVVWQKGDPVKTILSIARDKQVDLLLIGANKKEDLLTFYIGSVARQLSRQAPCSILILSERSVVRNPCKTLVVNGVNHPKTPISIATANHVGNALGANRMVVIDELEPVTANVATDDDEGTAKATEVRGNLVECEQDRLKALCDVLEGDLKVSYQCVFGKVGYTIGHAAQTLNADLLVVNSPDKKLGFMDRLFQHDLEYLLGEMPCCLLIVNPPTAHNA